MKLLKYILPLYLIALGCEDLNFPDPNSPSTASATVQSLVTGAEAGMRGSLSNYLIGVSSVGREAYHFEPADPRYTGELIHGPLDPGGFVVYSSWNSRYRVIKNCQLLLEKSDDKGVEGFAKTIEAHQLLLALNMQNNNGVKIAPYNGLDSDPASKSAAFTEIARLLDDASSALDAAGASFGFKLSSGFSGFDTPATFKKFNRALAGRVAVYMGQWDKALTALGQSFMDASGDMDLGVYHVFGSGQGDASNGMYENPNASYVRTMAHMSYKTDAEAGDPRYTSKIVERADTTVYDGLQSNLAVSVWGGAYDPVAIIRNEELVLLKAEANIGKGGDGLTEINAVRSAHGLADAASGGLDQLLHEKRYSLFMEGHRWVDMRRYGKTGSLPNDRSSRGDQVFDSFPIPEAETKGK
ncbi:MAG: RagB/SusD family nutrient uptake outer membrane protein [Candidatus Marinimicrobia bacterium]|jgi:hypothetical protein|nr:RagB/SusD family nutrient uptake outer membrane protein [Candidatus Neomarinimicrobiota bacterium]